MKKLFRADVAIYATAYIVAADADEAKKILATMPKTAIEVGCGQVGDGIVITGEAYSPDMPTLSLSPAMSIGDVDLEDEDGEPF